MNSRVAFEFARVGLPPEYHHDEVRKLALVDRVVLINYEVFLPLAAARGELPLASDLMHRLARVNATAAQMFHDAYPRFTWPLTEVAVPLVHEVTPEIESAALKKILQLSFRAKTAREFNVWFLHYALVARECPGALDEVLAIDRERLSQVPALRERWLIRGVDLITSGRSEEGIAFLRLQSAESRRLLGLTDAVLADLRSVIAFYCSSLCARNLGVLPLEVSSFQVDKPFTNGKAVFLPPTLGYFADVETNQRMYSAVAAQVAGGLALGSYGYVPAAGLATDLQARYGLQLPRIGDVIEQEYRGRGAEIRVLRTGDLELAFPNNRRLLLLETALEKFYFQFPVPVLVKRLFALLETLRIDTWLTKRYPGLGKDLTLLRAYQRRRRRAVLGGSSPNAQFETLLEGLIRHVLSPNEATSIPRELLAPCQKVGEEGATVEDTAQATAEVFHYLYAKTNVVAYCALHDVRTFFRDLVQPVYESEIVREDSPELLHGVSSTGPDFQDEDAGIDLTRSSQRDRRANDFVKAIQEGRTKVYQYPEFHVATGAYEPRYCTLFEQVAPSLDDGFYQRTLKKHTFTWKKLRKKFVQLKPEELEMQRKWLAGDEVHLDDALDYSTSLLRGTTPDEKIYSKKVLNVRDVALAVLVDSSSSTDVDIDGRKIIDIEKESLAILASSLDALGDDFALYSFYSMGKDKTVFSVIKDFRDPWGLEAQSRVGSFTAYAANRDGCAIRHATAKLLDTPNKTKVLLMLSDGIPADLGYGGGAGETNQHAIEDTRRAIQEARLKGVVPYCLTVDRDARAYIGHLYGELHYSILNDPARLPERLSRLYLRLTK